jgi:polyphosphate:AMP phosphotransferase
MFESAELGHAIGKGEYDGKVPQLRQALLDAQMSVLERGEFAVILLTGGEDGGGKGEIVNTLLSWMDPRHVRVHAFPESTEGELGRPAMWRYWRDLPPKGKIGAFYGAWYSPAIEDRAFGRMRGPDFRRLLAEFSRFERMLFDEGALIVKFWLHLSKKAQRERFEKLESNPATAWRVTKQDWKNHREYERFRKVEEVALRDTSTPEAPWTVVESADARYRNLTVGTALLDAMRARLDQGRTATPIRAAPAPASPIDARNVIEELDLSLSLTDAQYDRRLPKLQGRLNALSRDKRFRRHSCVLVFEGNDAAGKGGSIRRVTGALDARSYHVFPISAPTEEERAQPYLWRFWRHIPRKGHFAIFDRSWYGRVLVERVERLAAEPDWLRAYREIVDFEHSLVRFGIVVVKFWLAIGKDEQLTRFKAREKTPFKRFKITPDDWRNREKWDDYSRAVCDMVDRTSTDLAPWHLIEANDKKWARVKILDTICSAIESAIE